MEGFRPTRWEQIGNNKAQIPGKTSHQELTEGKTSQQETEFRRVSYPEVSGRGSAVSLDFAPLVPLLRDRGLRFASTGSLLRSDKSPQPPFI